MDYAELRQQMQTELTECEAKAKKLRLAIPALANLDGKDVERPLSRQRMYQIANNQKGLCSYCTRPIASGSKSSCEVHLQANRELIARRNGSKPWVPGGKGRAPLGVVRDPEVLQEA